MPLAALRPLWGAGGANFVSLQKQLKADEVEQLSHAGIANLGPEFADFGNTAAAIANLDLVICVDTAIAHLAGAMGKPVWLMLPAAADFRWLRDRDDSPWYPTMRLFRQQHLGEWDEVIARVEAALKDAVGQQPVKAEARWIAGARREVDRAKPGNEASKRSNDASADPMVFARVVESRYGIVQFMPGADDAARSVAWYGEYLQPQLALLGRMLRPGAVVLEAGSGIGLHTLDLARIVGATGHLFVYEGRPMVRRLLQQNLAANQITRGATLMRHALRGAVESGPLGTPSVPATQDANGSETVDDLLLDRLDLLKVSSATELGVLTGAGDTLWRLRPLLFLALADAASMPAIAAKVGEFAYRCWSVEMPCFSPDNFNGRTEDIFNGSMAWALLAVPEEVAIEIDFPGCVEWIGGTGPVPTGQVVQTDSETPSGAPEVPKAGLFGRLRKRLS